MLTERVLRAGAGVGSIPARITLKLTPDSDCPLMSILLWFIGACTFFPALGSGVIGALNNGHDVVVGTVFTSIGFSLILAGFILLWGWLRHTVKVDWNERHELRRVYGYYNDLKDVQDTIKPLVDSIYFWAHEATKYHTWRDRGMQDAEEEYKKRLRKLKEVHRVYAAVTEAQTPKDNSDLEAANALIIGMNELLEGRDR